MRLYPPSLNRAASSSRAAQASFLLTAAVVAAVGGSATAQRNFEEFGKRHLPSDAADTRALAHGDFDGDGDLDLVVGTFGQNRLYLNDGSGIYTDVTLTRMPIQSDNTTSLAIGDVDRDGDLDIMVGNNVNPFGAQSRLYLNNGAGTFTDMTLLRMPIVNDNTNAVVFGDIDRDGDLDLVIANYGQNRLYLNNGAGTFTNANRLPAVVDASFGVDLGDVDRDGDLDIVIANSRDQQNRIHLNNGAGTFVDATATRMPVDSDASAAVKLGDVDRDGDLDLVFGNFQRPSKLYLNNGTGTFAVASVGRMPSFNDATTSLAIGDLDADGDLDVLLGNLRQQNRLFLNDGTGTLSDASTSAMPANNDDTYSIILGDFDGDGDADIASGNAKPRNRIYLNSGSGGFADASMSCMPVNAAMSVTVALGDVDRDGDLDMVVGSYGQNRLYWNSGTGVFERAAAKQMPLDSDFTFALAFGDIDADGDLDLVVGNAVSPSRLYLNDGTGTFSDVSAIRWPANRGKARAIALADVDRDGDLDILTGDSSVRLFLNDGRGNFSDGTAMRLPRLFSPTSLALGDVDRDGDLDLVVGTYGQSRLALNDGSGVFTDVTAAHLPVDSDRTMTLLLGDLDADGDLDLVIGNDQQQNRLYLNNGTGRYSDATLGRMPARSDATTSLALGDIDNDGDLDLVVGNGAISLGQANRLYLNSGTASFSDVTATRLPLDSDFTVALAVGDVDADGDLDLVAANADYQDRLYKNLHRQLDAPFALRVGRTYQLDVYSRFGPSTTTELAFAFLSTGTAKIPLPPRGTLGIDPAFAISLPPFVVSQPAGLGSLTLLIPNQASLAGVPIYSQVLLVQQPVQERLTNVIGDIILR